MRLAAAALALAGLTALNVWLDAGPVIFSFYMTGGNF